MAIVTLAHALGQIMGSLEKHSCRSLGVKV